jgi:hypothetical protein
MVVPRYQSGWKWTRAAKLTQRNKKISKKVVQVWNFGHQAALFNGASMEAITKGFSEVGQLNSPVRTAR